MPHIAPRPRRHALLQGVSLTALVVAGTVPARAGTPFRSLNQALALAGHAAQAAISPATGVTASRQAALGTQNMARAAIQFRGLAAALSAAAGAPHPAPPIVVDGYGAGTGLQPAAGAASGNALWKGALTPDDPANAGGLTAGPAGPSVTVKQTAPVAQLTWKTFNVGARTTLTYDQSAGGTLATSWVAINTVQDPDANGSQILGAIHAQGKVYVLNRNGIAFGAGSTINVGSLIAATADIAQRQFSATADGQTSFDLYGAQVTTPGRGSRPATYYNPTFIRGTSAAITVDQGASIQTAAPAGVAGGGYVMLLGGNVANAGLIATPLGQTVLAAGTSFTLRQGFSGSVTAGNTTSTTLGSEVATTNPGQGGTFPTGSVANSGLILADQGDISLVGHALTQAGVLMATTTVNTRGTIHLLTPDDGTDPTSSVTLAANSLTEVLPEDDGQTELDSARAANVAGSATLNTARLVASVTTNPPLDNTDTLPDQLGQGRVEVSTGGAVDVAPGALVQVPGGQVAIGGGSQVTLEAGATLDVSGTNSAVLPASVNDLLVNVQPFQLADSAANRTGALKGTNVYVDERTLVQIAGGSYNGNVYTAGGLLQVGGFLGQVPHGIGELTAIGGQVTLQALQRVISSQGGTTTNTVVPGSVTTAPGSVINLQGGSVTYAAGPVAQSYVQTTDGTIYDVNDAPGNLVYAGIYAGDVIAHPRWHITDTYINPLLTPATITEAAYTVGRDAGGLTVNAASASLGGAVYAGVTLGQYQNGPRPAGVADPTLLAQTVVPLEGSLSVGNYLGGVLQPTAHDSNVIIQPGIIQPGIIQPGAVAAPPSGTQSGTSTVPSISIDATMLSAGSLANLAVSTAGGITVSAPITLADGGTLSLVGADIAIGASLTARGGAITLTDELARTSVSPTSSVALAPGAVLDTRGVWTNTQLDPAHVAGLGHANGGTVSIVTAGGVDLAAGSRIDVSSGGGILAGGRTLAARGGSVTIVTDVILPPAAGGGTTRSDAITLDAGLAGYGSAGGGTLSITAPAFQFGAGTPEASVFGSATMTGTAALAPVVLSSALLQTGFASYAFNGTSGLDVLPGAQVTAAEPIYVAGQGAALPTGSDPASAYTVILPALYTPVRGSDVLSQRQGASLALLSATDPNAAGTGGGGVLSVGAGAGITVDPGQSITLAAYDQLTVAGTLTAHGGAIALANTRTNALQADVPAEPTPSEFAPGVSIWLGAGSLLDVSGQAAVQTDALGRRFGQAGSGGAITLGGYDLGTNAQSSTTQATWAQVIVRPGATLDADGAQATVDVVPGTRPAGLGQAAAPVTLVGDGGSISARSLAGVALDGALLARAGGPGAAGGTLSVQIDPVQFGDFSNIPTTVYQPRQVVVSQSTIAVLPDPTLSPGDVSPAASYGTARVSQQQVEAGGFGSLRLAAQTGAVVFQGDVSLATSRSIVISSGDVDETAAFGAVSIAAPYVDFAGYSDVLAGDSGSIRPSIPRLASFATLRVSAALIDIGNFVYLGGTSLNVSGLPFGTKPKDPGFGPPGRGVTSGGLGFDEATFTSTGDIRFLGSTQLLRSGQLYSLGDITFRAAQLYPVSGQLAQVVAGINPDRRANVPLTYGRTLTVLGLGGAAPQAPYSVGGAITLTAGTIEQDGVVRAPQGDITLGNGESSGETITYASHVTLGPGSVTSISLAGQAVPFGGTVDGVTYQTPIGATAALNQPTLQLQAQSIDVQDGATVDLRGGGTLTGAAFVFGRGGTADVLTTPLLDISGGAAVANAQAQVAAVQPARTGDAVYAILPGYASAYAPVADPGAATTPTRIGQQITVASGEVAGLAAGTYTLLPATYALLPGGYRVELIAGTQPLGTSLPAGNFTTIAPVTLSVADTGIAGPVPSSALFTSGADVRQLSQYDEESYDAFQAASATQFGAPRPFLPQDAKTLRLTFSSVIGTGTALSFAPAALLKAPAAGGYGATVEIDAIDHAGPATIEVAGPGDVVSIGALVLQDATLNGLDAPRLVLGGTIAPDARSADIIDVTGDVGAVTVRPHARLVAGDVLLVTNLSGQIGVDGTISTIGAGPAAYDISTGFLLNTAFGDGIAFPALDVSQGQVVFLPNTDATNGASINIASGSALLAGGSLDVVAPNNTVVGVGAATLGARTASIAVSSINIGSQASLDSLAGQLPAGISFTPGALESLLNGNPALGVPAAAQLTLTATQEVNIVGSVALDSGTTDLVLNTPAIYGVGSAGDTARITTPGFTWNGVATQNALNVGTFLINASALPGGQIAAGLAGGSGSLVISSSGSIVLGYGPQTQANDQVQLDRLIAGYASVSLQSATEITANDKSSLTLYASQPQYGQPGTGGDLTLSAPLVTTDSAAVLKLASGGTLTLASPGAPAATGGVATLGGEIDVQAASVVIQTAVALPGGQFNATAAGGIALSPAAHLDLAGRTVHLFDQTVYAQGGSLSLESTSGDVLLSGGLIDVSATGTAAGGVSLKALAGDVALDGTLRGAAPAGQAGGSLSVIAGTLSTTTSAAASDVFGLVNQALDTGGFSGARTMEFGTLANGVGAAATSATQDVTIGNAADGTALLAAHQVSVTADLGSIDVVGTVDASGSVPGAISLSAQQDLTLAPTALLDAHATVLATDSAGAPIGAENRAHVTLTSAAGTLLLGGGTVDLSVPGGTAAQGQLVLNAPRVGADDVAISATGPLAVSGADSIALYAWRSYQPTDALGTVLQGAKGQVVPAGAVTLAGIDADNTAFIDAAGANPALAARLSGLSGTGAGFHLRPGVEIDSTAVQASSPGTAASGGTLTISGDLDFSGLRYSDVGYGSAVVAGRRGSGEAGSVVFRAAGDLVVNGSVSDGFAPPPDEKAADYLKADKGWVFLGGNADPLNADVLLPSSVTVTAKDGTVSHSVELGAGTTFDPSRAISLNYDITVGDAPVSASTVLPFQSYVAAGSDPVSGFQFPTVVIPNGGFVTTASITLAGGQVIAAGTFLAGGTIIPAGSLLGAGTVLPVQAEVTGATATDLVIPSGTSLSIFGGPLTLSEPTAALPVNAFLPSNTVPIFVTPGGKTGDTLKTVAKLQLRPVLTHLHGDDVQGHLYALAALLPSGSQSWDLGFVAGANQASADQKAVLPHATLAARAAGPAATANTAYQAPGSLLIDDQHYLSENIASAVPETPAFSVIRTGTGDLSLVAGGNIDQSSLYGIYTAGTQTELPGGFAVNHRFDLGRQDYNAKSGVVKGDPDSTINRIISTTYRANYPDHGGDVTVIAGGSLTGDLYGNGGASNTVLLPSDEVGNWLWRQGGAQAGQSTAWWINFGTFVTAYASNDTAYLSTVPQLTGFQGIGALGGGNVFVAAAQDAGQSTDRAGADVPTESRGEGLVVAVGSTGRVVSTGGTLSTVATGGGVLTLKVGGTLNPLDAAAYGLSDTNNNEIGALVNGSVIDLRGDISVSAGAVGRLDPVFSTSLATNAPDARPVNPYLPTYLPIDGITVVPGDGTTRISTMRDLVLDGVGDAGRSQEQNLTALKPSVAKTHDDTGGATGFTLWTPATTLSLFASGGNVSPVVTNASAGAGQVLNDASNSLVNDAATDGRLVYPSQLFVTAATGSIAYGNPNVTGPNYNAVEVMPSAFEQVAFLAGRTIAADGFAFDLSGADPATLSTPDDPAFSSATSLSNPLTNVRLGAGTTQSPFALFALAPDTPTSAYLSPQAAAAPALFYAAGGDILNFNTGETLTFAPGSETLPNWYLAAKPVRIMASQDIIDSGTRPILAPGSLQQNQQELPFSIHTSGNLFLNASAQSVSVVSAGRDILSGYFYVGGPGLLDVTAGRNVSQIGYTVVTSSGNVQALSFGSIKSLGSLLSGAPVSLTGGAAISLAAGLGSGLDYTGFAELYLDRANQADLALQITDPANAGRVQMTYETQLLAFLQSQYGYTGTQADALAFFLDPARVPVESRQAFLRTVFYDELLASGRQYNDPTSRFAGSYTRGRQAIDTLLPGENGQVSANGVPRGYVGAITMASGTAGVTDASGNLALFDAGVATEHGGDIEVIAPGGQVVLGTSGSVNPGGGTGLITNGFGNIDVFARDSVLLGKSRIFTNAGGNIQIWSAEGDINAGIGARTSVVFSPPVVSYDNTGGLVDSPSVPTSGAGIATQQPLPSIPPGDIDLTAPEGTIDAGEAGVRSSGNVNLAALVIANAAGITAGGKTTGIVTAPTISASTSAAAGAAAGAATQAAQSISHPRAQQQEPSVIEVEVLSIAGAEAEEEKRRRRHL